MKLFSLFLLISVFATSAAVACDCGLLADTFEKTVRLHNEQYGEKYPLTVVTGTVLKHENFKDSYHGKFPLQMSFAVSEVIQGKVQTETITVKGDNGMMCRPYISKFPEGTRWSLALQRERTGDYFVSICGRYYEPAGRE